MLFIYYIQYDPSMLNWQLSKSNFYKNVFNPSFAFPGCNYTENNQLICYKLTYIYICVYVNGNTHTHIFYNIVYEWN